MNKKILFAILATVTIITVTLATVLLASMSSKDCLVYGTSYEPIKKVTLDDKNYYVYSSISGFQEKTHFITLSLAPLPNTVCDYSKISTPIYSTDIDPEKQIKKIKIYKNLNNDLYIEPEYFTQTVKNSNNLANIEIEIEIVN